MAQLPRTATIGPPRPVTIPAPPEARRWRPEPVPAPPVESLSAPTRPFGSLRIEAAEVVIAGLLRTRHIPIEDVVFARAGTKGRLRIETLTHVHRVRLRDPGAAVVLSRAIQECAEAAGGGGRFDGGV
ncbi:MAG: hypothetical protein R3C39_14260 [Dehalococcoidia bacterium]